MPPAEKGETVKFYEQRNRAERWIDRFALPESDNDRRLIANQGFNRELMDADGAFAKMEIGDHKRFTGQTILVRVS